MNSYKLLSSPEASHDDLYLRAYQLGLAELSPGRVPPIWIGSSRVLRLRPEWIRVSVVTLALAFGLCFGLVLASSQRSSFNRPHMKALVPLPVLSGLGPEAGNPLGQARNLQPTSANPSRPAATTPGEIARLQDKNRRLEALVEVLRQRSQERKQGQNQQGKSWAERRASAGQ